MEFPDNLKYTKDHEWVAVDGKIATIGITAFAAGELGDVVFVEINEVGAAFAQHDVFGTVEAVKTVSDLFMPVGGVIVETNPDLDGSPETVNNDPYGKGWMIKAEITNPSELDGLMSAADYKALIGQ